MGKKAIAKTYNLLVKNCWIDALFYIPESNLATAFLKKLKGIEKLDTMDIYNKVFVIDQQIGPMEFDEENSNSIISKKELLENNIYLLIKKKKQLNKLEFEFILDRYFEQVELFFYVSNWIKKDLQTNTQIEISDKTRGLLVFQYQYYKNHFELLIKYFYPKLVKLPTSNFNIETTIEKYFPRIIKHNTIEEINSIPAENILKAHSKNNSTITDAIELTETTNTSKQKVNPKQPILTTEDAKQFLRESVFNIKE